MNKIISFAFAVLLATGLFLTTTACKGPAVTAYKVTAATYATVDAAMLAWGDYVANFHPGAATEAKVKQAYLTWQKASLAAIDTAKAAQASDPTTKTRVNAAIAAAAQALSGLIDVLAPFGINLQPTTT